mgnify:CR=1 FL=1
MVTGISVAPATSNINDFNGVKMNVPSKMFKIVCIEFQDIIDICHLEIFQFNNKPYKINYLLSKYDLSRYLLLPTQIEQFSNLIFAQTPLVKIYSQILTKKLFFTTTSFV